MGQKEKKKKKKKLVEIHRTGDDYNGVEPDYDMAVSNSVDSYHPKGRQ